MARRKRSRISIPKVIGATLARIFGQNYENDSLELNNGRHEIEIELGKKPGRVWVSLYDEQGDLPVCGGNVDKVGTVDTDNGFILHADIHSTSRKVRWFASLG